MSDPANLQKKIVNNKWIHVVVRYCKLKKHIYYKKMSQIFSGNLLGISKEASKIGESMELWEGVRVTRSHNVNTITKTCCWCHKHIDGSVHVNLFNNRYFWVHGSCDVDNYSAVCFTPTFDTISEFADYIKDTICNQTIDRREWSEIATVLSNH